jgi:hypothetical protein
VSSGGARAGEGAPGSRATGATAAVSFGSEEAGTGRGAEAGGETDSATGGSRAGAVAAGAGASGATAAALGLDLHHGWTNDVGRAHDWRGRQAQHKVAPKAQHLRPPIAIHRYRHDALEYAYLQTAQDRRAKEAPGLKRQKARIAAWSNNAVGNEARRRMTRTLLLSCGIGRFSERLRPLDQRACQIERRLRLGCRMAFGVHERGYERDLNLDLLATQSWRGGQG